jgi:hypothetical protein
MAKGIRISQRGLDIEKAADYQLVMDSKVPTPGVVFEDEGIITENKGLIKLASHTLGFRPLTLFFVDTADTTTPNDDRWGIDSFFLGKVNEEGIYFDTSSVNAYPTRYKYMVFNIPADVDYDSPITNPESGVSSKPSTVGMQVSKPGHIISERQMENFSLNTDSKTLQIHAIRWGSGTEDDPQFAPTNIIRVRHNLGYAPFIISTLETTGSTSDPAGLLEFGFIQLPPRVTDTDAVAIMVPNRKFGLIVFKDPLTPKEVQPVEVVYG